MSENIEIIAAEIERIKTVVDNAVTTRNVKNKIKDVDSKLDGIIKDHSSLSAEVKDKDSKIKSLEAELDDKNLKISEVELNLLNEQAKNNNIFSAQIKAKGSIIETYQMKLSSFQLKNSILNDTIKMLKDDKKNICKEAKVKEAKLEDLAFGNAALAAKAKVDMYNQLEEKNARIHEIEQKLEDSKKANAFLHAIVKSKNSEIYKGWNKLVERETKITKITNALQNAKQENNYLKALIESKDAKLKKTEVKLHTINTKILVVNSQLKDIVYPVNSEVGNHEQQAGGRKRKYLSRDRYH